ncbi:phage tail protein [Acinetobacter sp. ANC 4635]|uniref:phage tail protein n=1 Tax=Acinetobacter sp. ANC 4635 TaxID=2529846 RepID=UPI00103CA046|nr:phage tail protein [Acinetobacter sp. ANC 4635]TCB32172.1 phage tail protein [Acinetobacter sp. ANC 4635]
MDRQTVYAGAIPLETDLLNTNKNVMIALAKLSAAILGTNTVVNGLTVTAQSPAAMAVNVAPGEIYMTANVDTNAYSSLAADTSHQITKQGILLDSIAIPLAAPSTVGYSVNYLIQATYQDADANSVTLPYYNSSNPSQAWSGPNNTGTAQYTTRKGAAIVTSKAGVAATTGTQTTPSPDSGYVGLYVVTVAYGAASITQSNISTYANAPFIPTSGILVGGLQNNLCNSSVAGGTSDALTGSYNPGITSLPSAGNGVLTLYLRAASANTTATPTFTPNSGTIAAKTIVKGAGSALVAGDIAGGGHWIELQYDATLDKWVLLNPATGVSTTQASVAGAFSNLKISTVGINNYNSVITANSIVLKNSSGGSYLAQSVNATGNINTVGANGLDTGALAASMWYYVHVIYNPTTQTTAALFSLSATNPTLPSGYTYSARVGAVRTDGSVSKYLLQTLQEGKRVQYGVLSGSNTASLPFLASGSSGSVATPTWTPVSWGNFAPPSAYALNLVLGTPVTSSGTSMVAPNNSYGAYNSATNPPPLMSQSNSATSSTYLTGTIVPESSNIYYAANVAGSFLACLGWEDNL